MPIKNSLWLAVILGGVSTTACQAQPNLNDETWRRVQQSQRRQDAYRVDSSQGTHKVQGNQEPVRPTFPSFSELRANSGPTLSPAPPRQEPPGMKFLQKSHPSIQMQYRDLYEKRQELVQEQKQVMAFWVAGGGIVSDLFGRYSTVKGADAPSDAEHIQRLGTEIGKVDKKMETLLQKHGVPILTAAPERSTETIPGSGPSPKNEQYTVHGSDQTVSGNATYNTDRGGVLMRPDPVRSGHGGGALRDRILGARPGTETPSDSAPVAVVSPPTLWGRLQPLHWWGFLALVGVIVVTTGRTYVARQRS